MMTIWAANSGEALLRITAFQILPDDVGDYWSIKSAEHLEWQVVGQGTLVILLSNCFNLVQLSQIFISTRYFQ